MAKKIEQVGEQTAPTPSTLLSLGHEIELTSRNLAKRAEGIRYSLYRASPKPASRNESPVNPPSDEVHAVLARTLLALADVRTTLIRIEGIIGAGAGVQLGKAIGQ